jgi:hypothetical protein
MTSLIDIVPINATFHTPIKWSQIDLNFGDASLAAMKATGTHNVLTVPEGYAIVAGYAVVQTTFTFSSAGTIKFAMVNDLTGTRAAAELAAGDVFALLQNDLEDTTSAGCYAVSDDDTLDLIVGTDAVTAGRLILYVGMIDVASGLANTRPSWI